MGIGSIKRSSSTKSSELLLKAVRMRPVRLPLKNLCNGTDFARYGNGIDLRQLKDS